MSPLSKRNWVYVRCVQFDAIKPCAESANYCCCQSNIVSLIRLNGIFCEKIVVRCFYSHLRSISVTTNNEIALNTFLTLCHTNKHNKSFLQDL